MTDKKSGPPVGIQEDRHNATSASGPRVTRPDDIRALLLATAEQAAQVDAAFRDGYALGFPAGVAVGEQRASAERLAEDDQLADDRKTFRLRAEVAALRAQPSGPAYYVTVLRNGGTEFGGVGKPRVPVAPEVLTAATAWLNREVQRRGVAA